MNLIFKVIRSNRLVYYLYNTLKNGIYYNFLDSIYNTKINIKKFLREKRINRKSTYEKLRGIKNKHEGERCFIVATGPSLTIQDLEKLRNEITFSMNSICMAFEETDWRPTYYGIQDKDVFQKFNNQIAKFEMEGVFIADVITQEIKNQNQYIYPLHLLNHLRNHFNYNTKFSKDAFSVVYDGYSITYSLIQIAAYMGFKEIYLIGADSNYSKNMVHHFKDYGIVDSSYYTAGARMIHAYEVAKRYSDKNDFKIFNATRGGMLEVFERVDLDTILSSSKNVQNIKSNKVRKIYQ